MYTNVTTEIVLWKWTKLKGGGHPVKLRVTYMREPKYYGSKYGLKMALTEKEFQSVMKNPRGENRKKRDFLEAYKSQVEKFISELGPFNFSFEALEGKMRKVSKTKSILFTDAIQEYSNEIENKKTKESYLYTLNMLSKYKPKINSSGITPDFLKKFDAHLQRAGNSQSTVAIHMRQIRAVWNWLKRQGQVREDLYPFGIDKYLIRKTTHSKHLVSKEDIKTLINFKSTNSSFQEARDLFVLSLFCGGANPVDTFLLTPKNIRNEVVSFNRTKTGILIEMPIIDPVAEILERQPKGRYLLPVINNNIEKDCHNARMRANRNLKKIVKTKIALSYARNSFSSYAADIGTPVPIIKALMGHSTGSITEGYMSFPVDTKKRWLNELKNYFK